MFVVVAVLFFLPGLVVLAALGLRGWRLAALAPAVTFGLVATGGAVLNAIGVRWSLVSFAVWTAAVAVLVFAVGWLWARRRPATDPTVSGEGPVRRSLREHLLVAGGVVLGMGVGATVFLRASRALSATTQEWDAPFHANAVRWIAEHGHAVPSAVAPIANIPADQPYFYPVTYHSLLALVVQSFGATPSWVLNAGALTVVLIWPLGVAAMGLAWRLPVPAVAVAAAVSTWFSAFPFDSLWRGPLWPYVAGLAMLPGVLAAGRLLLERSSIVRPGLAIALGITGMIAMHPSLAFILFVYVLALAVALLLRWEPVRWRSAALPMLVTAGLTVLILLPVVLPARAQSSGVQAARWPEFASQAEGLGQVLLFSPVTQQPQWWLGLPALAGVVLMIRKRQLLWVLLAWLVLGGAYAATASMDNWLVNTISGPFYNDAWRFAAALPLAGTFAVGVAVSAAGAWLAPRVRLGRSWTGAVAATAVALVVLGLLGNGAYINRNTTRLGQMYADGPTVSSGEMRAYTWLARHLKPGEQVMNDRNDGSVWMYASSGVRPLVMTFYGAPGSVADTLEKDLNRLDDSPAVRRMLDEAHVRYVFVGRGFIRPGTHRAPGLQGLAHVEGLEQVYRTRDAIIYEVADR